MYKRLYVWVEGEDDRMFFDYVVRPILEEKYDYVETRKYKEEKKEKVNNFLKSIKAMNADYIFASDINANPCATAKKQKLKHTYKDIDEDTIIVVKRMIESWYLAGMNKKNSKKLGVPCFNDTDDIIKKQFGKMIPKNFDSRIDFMTEILKCFSIDVAKQKNESFKYFIEKYDC